MKKICFFVPHAFSLFEHSCKHPFGGSEVQSWLLAQGLSRLPDVEVSFIVLNHKQSFLRKYGPIKVFRHSYYCAFPKKIDQYRDDVAGIRFKQAGFPWIAYKGKTPKMFFESLMVRLYDLRLAVLKHLSPSIFIDHYEIMADQYRIFKQVDADVYLASGVHESAAELAAFCKHYHKKFVLLTASDYDISETHSEGNWQKDRYNSFGHLCFYAIQQASAIITQTQAQQTALKQRYGTESTVITNPVDLENQVEAPAYSERRHALWIGKADRVKRPDLLLLLAQKFPEISFTMVMNPSQPDIYTQICQQLPENTHFMEYVPFEKIDHLFAQAFVLINTSDFEGFPNTYLQAGKYGVPILTLNADPDGFIQKHECGLAAGGDFDKLSRGLKTIHSDKNKASVFSENIKAYVRQNHSLESKTHHLYRILSETLNSSR